MPVEALVELAQLLADPMIQMPQCSLKSLGLVLLLILLLALLLLILTLSRLLLIVELSLVPSAAASAAGTPLLTLMFVVLQRPLHHFTGKVTRITWRP